MPQTITPDQYPQLAELINETYTDGIEKVVQGRIEDDGAIVALVTDEDRLVAFKYTDEVVSVKILNPEVVEGGAEGRGDEIERVQPEPIAIAPINLRAFDWDTARDVAAEKGWTWDEEEAQYRKADGQLVSPDDVLLLTQEILASYKEDLAVAADMLVDDEMDVNQWVDEVNEAFTAVALLFFLLGIGGRDRLRREYDEHIATRLETQRRYLELFADSVAMGKMSRNGLRARSFLYLQDAEIHFSEAQEFAHPPLDWPYYRSILGGCDHCEDCPSEADKGWVERGGLIPIGSRSCFVNCCCHYEYAKDKNGRQDTVSILARGHGWL